MLIFYFAFQALQPILSSFMDSALALGDLGLIGDIESLQDISKFQNAGKIFDSSIGGLIILAISLFLSSAILSSLFKGFGYCRLRGEKFGFGYLRKSIAFNILWRGFFIGLFLLSFAIIKPEMLFWFWIVLLILFYYFTPIIYMNISAEKMLWGSIKNGFKTSMKKAHIILLSYILFVILVIAFYLPLKFLPNYVFYFVYFLVVMLLVGLMKLVLVRYLK